MESYLTDGSIEHKAAAGAAPPPCRINLNLRARWKCSVARPPQRKRAAAAADRRDGRRAALPDSSELIIKRGRAVNGRVYLSLGCQRRRLQSVVANPRLAEPRSARLWLAAPGAPLIGQCGRLVLEIWLASPVQSLQSFSSRPNNTTPSTCLIAHLGDESILVRNSAVHMVEGRNSRQRVSFPFKGPVQYGQLQIVMFHPSTYPQKPLHRPQPPDKKLGFSQLSDLMLCLTLDKL